MNDLISGALVTGYAIVGLYFFKFWKQSRDRLFVWFALAFWVLALQRFLLALSTPIAHGGEIRAEGNLFLYVIRLIAFVLVLIGIIDKNRAPSKNTRDD